MSGALHLAEVLHFLRDALWGEAARLRLSFDLRDLWLSVTKWGRWVAGGASRLLNLNDLFWLCRVWEVTSHDFLDESRCLAPWGVLLLGCSSPGVSSKMLTWKYISKLFNEIPFLYLVCYRGCSAFIYNSQTFCSSKVSKLITDSMYVGALINAEKYFLIQIAFLRTRKEKDYTVQLF